MVTRQPLRDRANWKPESPPPISSTRWPGARSQAEITRGQGDAESARIYAQAYSKDPEFYAFVRSLEAYRATMKGSTTMVLPPDHEFFRFLDPNPR